MKEIKSFSKSFIGFLMAALVINSGWGIFINKFGVKGGWISALILTGSMWYINHYLGMVDNKKEAISIDMGMAVGLSLIIRDIFKNGMNGLENSFPTLICVCIGGIVGGSIAGYIQKVKKVGNIS